MCINHRMALDRRSQLAENLIQGGASDELITRAREGLVTCEEVAAFEEVNGMVSGSMLVAGGAYVDQELIPDVATALYEDPCLSDIERFNLIVHYDYAVRASILLSEGSTP